MDALNRTTLVRIDRGMLTGARQPGRHTLDHCATPPKRHERLAERRDVSLAEVGWDVVEDGSDRVRRWHNDQLSNVVADACPQDCDSLVPSISRQDSLIRGPFAITCTQAFLEVVLLERDAVADELEIGLVNSSQSSLAGTEEADLYSHRATCP